MPASDEQTARNRLFNRAFEFLQQGDYHSSIDAHQKLLTSYPNHVLGHFNLGIALERAGDDEAAFYAYQRASQLDPSFTKAHLNIGVLLEGQQRFDDAIAVYRQALEIDPSLGKIHANLCNALTQVKQKTEAIAAGKLAVEYSPELANAHNNLGIAYLNVREFQLAQSCFERALTLEPKMKLALGNMGLVLERQNRFQESKQWYERVIAEYPDYAKARVNYSWLLIDLQRWEESVRMSVSAMELMINEVPSFSRTAIGSAPKVLHSPDCLEALVRFRDILASHGIQMFLVYGTLLGCMRDRNFISYDTDIDVGIWSDAQIIPLIDQLESNGFELRLSYDRNSGQSFDEVLANTINLPFYYKGRIAVDVYRHFPEVDLTLSGFELGGRPLIYEVSNFELQKVKLLGERFDAPKNYETYLTECYGDWIIPDALFETSISSPNLAGGFPSHARALAYHRAAVRMEKKKYEGCLYVLEALIAKDASLEESIIQILKKLKAKLLSD